MFNRLIRFLEGVPQDSPSPEPRSPFFTPREESLPTWSLDEELFRFSPHPADVFTLRDANAGVVIFGGTGSGKTSGSGKVIAKAYLRGGYGGLVLCAKPSEVDLWRQYAAETGRSSHLIEFGRTDGDIFPAYNFLDAELKRGGVGAGQTDNILNLFLAITNLAERKNGKSANADFWQRAMAAMLRNAIDLLKLARGTVTLREISEIINTAPQSLKEAEKYAHDYDGELPDSPFYQYLLQAEKNSRGDADKEYLFDLISTYWIQEFPGIPDKTRSGFVETYRGLANVFLRDPIRKLFCQNTTVTPELLQDGAILIVNLPVLEWNEIGQFANCLWLYVVMKSIERRPNPKDDRTRPVFIWADEAQHFVLSQSQLFATTAREARACTVYLSQNIRNYYEALGGTDNNPVVDALMACLTTKIFHAQSDKETNTWAAETIGRESKYLSSFSQSKGTFDLLNAQTTTGMSETIDYSLLPREFTILNKGWPDNNCLTEAIIFMAGRKFSNGKTFLKCAFNQRA